ncbi:MAG: type II toxin-antitoxin system VapC family toxin [Saprospiraceae bacterium]|nr:type II toxin-antitoxin system VapC family toxin [Saprospiraceae bacterium]
MKYLLDTHAMVWAITETSKLSPSVREILEDPNHQILVSPVSFWEISLKYSLGKLELVGVLPEDLPSACSAMDFDIQPLEPNVASTLHYLKGAYHKDPFDRMLIWHAIYLKIPLISKDPVVAMYSSEGLAVVWE